VHKSTHPHKKITTTTTLVSTLNIKKLDIEFHNPFGKCAFGVVQEILLLIFLLFGVSQLAYILGPFVVGLAYSGKDIVLRFIIVSFRDFGP